MNKIYLDNNSTTKLDPEILESFLPFFSEKYGNSSSKTHAFGWEADAYVEESRKKISKLINANTNEIIFTSGATESNNIALLSTLESPEKMHFITALLYKIKNSKGTIDLLGDGTPLRQFMYA